MTSHFRNDSVRFAIAAALVLIPAGSMAQQVNTTPSPAPSSPLQTFPAGTLPGQQRININLANDWSRASSQTTQYQVDYTPMQTTPKTMLSSLEGRTLHVVGAVARTVTPPLIMGFAQRVGDEAQARGMGVNNNQLQWSSPSVNHGALHPVIDLRPNERSFFRISLQR